MCTKLYAEFILHNMTTKCTCAKCVYHTLCTCAFGGHVM